MAKKVHYIFDMYMSTDMTVDGLVELLKRKGAFQPQGRAVQARDNLKALPNRKYHVVLLTTTISLIF